MSLSSLPAGRDHGRGRRGRPPAGRLPGEPFSRLQPGSSPPRDFRRRRPGGRPGRQAGVSAQGGPADRDRAAGDSPRGAAAGEYPAGCALSGRVRGGGQQAAGHGGASGPGALVGHAGQRAAVPLRPDAEHQRRSEPAGHRPPARPRHERRDPGGPQRSGPREAGQAVCRPVDREGVFCPGFRLLPSATAIISTARSGSIRTSAR